jgi:nucleotide-binding universal stress UspA family protein
MKVLIATDGSECSFQAIHQVCRILSPARDEIVLYYAPPGGDKTDLDSTTIEQGRQELSGVIFDAAIKRFPEVWQPKVQKLVGSGDPRNEIANTAGKIGANLIAVGARGLGTVSRLLLGSVSRYVVHTAKAPVLVARSSEPEHTHEGIRVLLASETPASGGQLAELVGRCSWPAGSSCTVLNVVPSVLGGTVPEWLTTPERSPEVQQLISAWVDEEQAQLSAAKQQTETVCKSLSLVFSQCSVKVAQGQIATEIVEAARKHHADLIVLGSKSSSALGRLFIGNTCEAVLNRAACSVLVVPQVG